MEKKQPDLGDTPGFAKALAELKKDVPTGDDPLYFDVTKGARLLTRDEKHKIFDEARGRGVSAGANLREAPAVVAPAAPLGTHVAPARVRSIRALWLWRASGGLVGVVIIVFLAWLVRKYVGPRRSAETPEMQATKPSTEAPTLAVTTGMVGDTPAPTPTSVVQRRPTALPAPSTPARSKARLMRPAPEVPLSAASAADRPTIDNPERY
jgi:hypothetical protein